MDGDTERGDLCDKVSRDTCAAKVIILQSQMMMV